MRGLLGLALLAGAALCGGSASAATIEKITARCAMNDGGVPASRMQAWSRAVTDKDGLFGNFDLNCDGRIDDKEMAAYINQVDRTAERVIGGLEEKTLKAAKGPKKAIPVAVLDADPAVARGIPPMDFKAKPVPGWLYIRDAYANYSIFNPPPARDRADGAQVSYTRDAAADNDVFSAVGAITAYKRLEGASPKIGTWTADAITVAAGVEFDRINNRHSPKQNMNYLGFKGIIEVDASPPDFNGWLTGLAFRYAPYLKTDFDGRSEIVGNYVEIAPESTPLAIGSGAQVGKLPMVFRWAPAFRVEAERVVDATGLAGVVNGDRYLRAGPIIQANLWFLEPFERLKLDALYQKLWSARDDGHDIEYWQGTAAYNLDPDGNFALSFKYREGTTPGNGTYVRDYKVGFAAKY